MASGRAIHRPIPLPVLEQVVGRLRTLDQRTRELKAALAGEIEVSFEIPPPPTWRPISRIGLLLVALGLLVAGGAFAVNRLTTIELGTAPLLLGGAIAGIGLILAFVAVVASAATTASTPSSAMSRSTAASAAAPRWKPS
jgi:hypothetical protein